MADLQITQLPELGSAQLQATDPIAVADVSATETKKITAKNFVQGAFGLVDNASIPATALSYPLSVGQIVTATLADNAVTNAKITNATITGAKLANNTITATQIAANAITSSELADNAVDTAAITNFSVATEKIANLAITSGKIRDGAITFVKTNFSNGDIPGAKITSASITATQIADDAVTSPKIADSAVSTARLADDAVTGAKIASDTITAGNIAANAIGASELADNSVDTAALTTNAVTTAKITDLNITTGKLANNAVTAAKIADDTITATQIAANAVGSSELADNAVDTAAIAATAVTDAKIASGIAGTKITDGTITAAKLNTSNIDRSLNVASGNLGINNAVSGGASSRNGITYNTEGLITATAALVASDIPEATASAVGGVSVPTAGGLTVNNLGAISINNTITGTTRSGITFSNKGLITGTVPLVASDLPVATTSAVGAISIPTTSTPLTVSGAGVLSIANSGVAAGSYTKVTVSTKGIVTAGTTLVESDIPNLATTKITTGTFGTNFLANDSITMDKLANLSTGFIQEASPDITDLPTGVFWLQESTGQLRIFNGNSFFSVGFGRLSEENLRFCGTFNATNGLIVTLTSFGTSAGFSVGNAIPAGTASLTGAYFVCVTPGNGTAVVPATSFDAGDWCLCMGLNDWDRIDTLSGPGSVSSLNDLSDVTISSPQTGQILVMQAGGSFQNVSVISGGTY